MDIRNDIRKSLAAKLDDSQLAMAAERIGRLFDEEMDKARRYGSRRGVVRWWRRRELIASD